MKKRLLSLFLTLCVLCSMLVVPASAATVEAEENNSIETANVISVNTEVSGSISSTSDVDWYQFELPQDGFVSLTFAHDFVNSSSRYWTTSLYTSGNQKLDSWEWNGNSTTAGTGNKIGLKAGTYYVCVEDYYFSPETYWFTVNYTPADNWEKEFNETIVTANPISTDASVYGSIRSNSDVDWYQFELPQDGFVSLTFAHDFVNDPSRYWTTSVFTSENQKLDSWEWKGNSTTAETENKIGLKAGTYYVCVEDYYFSPETYWFTVNYTPADNWEKEFNETIKTANPISTDASIYGSIRNSNDVDWYQFELPQDGFVSLTFAHDFVDNSSRYWTTSLYTSANQKLDSWEWKGNSTTAGTGSKIGLKAGTYYVCVEDYYFSSATYWFTVNLEASGEQGGNPEQQPVPVTGVTLSKSSLTLAVGGSASLTATVSPGNAADKSVTWTSSKDAVARVDANGRVTAVAAGTADITATTADGGYTAACRVTVKADAVKVTGVTLSKSSLTLAVGGSANLTATVSPSNAADKSVTWTSNNPAAVSVDANGRVTALAAGAAEIVVRTADGGFTAICRVIVKGEDKPAPAEVHFPRMNIYNQGQFTDVPANQWYTDGVKQAFEFGLMKGTSAKKFDPQGSVTVAQAITMAARIHSIYTTGGENFVQGRVWYQVYLDYAFQNGVISYAYYNSDVTKKATRAQFAEIFAGALPEEALSPANDVDDGAIPDVPMSAAYAAAVYKLYRAGILAGNDMTGTFSPESYITRQEAATIVTRMAESSSRKSFTLG